MKTIQRAFDYAVYGLQYAALYSIRFFSAYTIFSVLYIGFLIVTASWLITIFGEERTIAFATNHPYLFMWCVLLFTASTCGLAYWSYSREPEDMHANLRRRLAKHSPLFNVA